MQASFSSAHRHHQWNHYGRLCISGQTCTIREVSKSRLDWWAPISEQPNRIQSQCWGWCTGTSSTSSEDCPTADGQTQSQDACTSPDTGEISFGLQGSLGECGNLARAWAGSRSCEERHWLMEGSSICQGEMGSMGHNGSGIYIYIRNGIAQLEQNGILRRISHDVIYTGFDKNDTLIVFCDPDGLDRAFGPGTVRRMLQDARLFYFL